MNPRAAYRTSHPHELGDRGAALAVRADVVADVLASRAPAAAERDVPLFPFASGPSSAASYLRLRRLLSSVGSGSVEAIEFEEDALSLDASAVGAALRGASERARPPRERTRRRDAAAAARGLLASRFREAVRLEEVARAVGLSTFHLCRTFKEETGTSVHRYLHRLRLRWALECLGDRRGDLTALALELGYSSHSHFSAAFRREFGVAPSTLCGRAALARAARKMMTAAAEIAH